MQRIMVVGKSCCCECAPAGKLTEPLTNAVPPCSSMMDCTAFEASATVGYGVDSIHRVASIGFWDAALMTGIVIAIAIVVISNILYCVFIPVNITLALSIS